MANFKTWQIDAAHSNVSFKIKHLELNKINGSLLNFSGYVKQIAECDFLGSKFHFKGDASSIFTGHEERDVHLRSEDFFDCANHSLIQFKSTEVDRIDDEHYFIKGQFSLKGISKKITLTAHFKGQKKGVDGNNRIGFEITSQLRTIDFNMNWNGINEDGVPLIDESVWVHICLLLKDDKK